jgi:tetrahydromethanopterin S-methyltransferase subunit E
MAVKRHLHPWMYATLVLAFIATACVVVFVVTAIFGIAHELAVRAFMIGLACTLIACGTQYLHKRAERRLGEASPRCLVGSRRRAS